MKEAVNSYWHNSTRRLFMRCSEGRGYSVVYTSENTHKLFQHLLPIFVGDFGLLFLSISSLHAINHKWTNRREREEFFPLFIAVKKEVAEIQKKIVETEKGRRNQSFFESHDSFPDCLSSFNVPSASVVDVMIILFFSSSSVPSILYISCPFLLPSSFSSLLPQFVAVIEVTAESDFTWSVWLPLCFIEGKWMDENWTSVATEVESVKTKYHRKESGRNNLFLIKS